MPSNIKAFESTAKNYNIDFSLKKVKGVKVNEKVSQALMNF